MHADNLPRLLLVFCNPEARLRCVAHRKHDASVCIKPGRRARFKADLKQLDVQLLGHRSLSVGGVMTPTVGRPVDSRESRVGGVAAQPAATHEEAAA